MPDEYTDLYLHTNTNTPDTDGDVYADIVLRPTGVSYPDRDTGIVPTEL